MQDKLSLLPRNNQAPALVNFAPGFHDLKNLSSCGIHRLARMYQQAEFNNDSYTQSLILMEIDCREMLPWDYSYLDHFINAFNELR